MLVVRKHRLSGIIRSPDAELPRQRFELLQVRLTM